MNFITQLFTTFHIIVMFFVFIIGMFVIFMLFFLYRNVYIVKISINLQLLEFIWTLLPACILLCVGVPSLLLLYTYDVERFSLLTIKVTAHQWYWSYSYRDFYNLEFDRYLKRLDDLKLGELRLLAVDNHLVLPFGVNICFIVTSGDVIHSWALPSMALKVDANPGILTTIHSSFVFPGLYYGQCREICGVNHRFIPIGVEVTSPALFKTWLLSLENK